MILKKCLLGAVFIVSACRGDSVPRMELGDELISVANLAGYELRHDKGSAVLASTDTKKRDASIVIRRVSFARRHDRNTESVAEATGKSLANLPGAIVEGPAEVEDSIIPGIQFDLSYEPKSKRGQKYDRRHVVLFGEENFYHVLHTAPQGQLSSTSKDFARVVQTLREDG